ncbi:DEAD/DEAH box helicase family protein [Virgibacillus proomii]|uniref:DEAD/DEAH box helicase family protein n=1 Tax=Virgibacillus proomii TaxID=84407 RepID=UPI0015C2FA7F|nr:DEAD/DEAH box helicase family protein [Virgibacillus proomii]
MEYWEQELGISFDHSQHLLKMIYASGKKVHINRKQKPTNLQQYVDEFLEEKKKMKKKKRKVSNKQVARKLADERFNNFYKINGVNFDAIVKALEELPFIDDYDTWFNLLLTFHSMMIEGLIDRNQVYELCEIIDDGEGKYKEEFNKIERYGYVGRTMGSFIYDLQTFDIDTKGIFQLSEKYEMRIDKEWEIEGYLSDNVQVCKEFKDLLLSSPGKRILFIGDTGIGKSRFILDVLDEFNVKLQSFKKMYRSISSLSYSIMSIPRRNLINNLKNSFSTEKSAVLTGSDEMIKGQRESIIANNDKFLTTPDHANVILDMKLTEGENVRRRGYDSATLDVLKHHRIMILDECHMLANDSTFKSETIERYLAEEEEHLKNNGVVLHMTATPESLTIGGVYDLVIKVTQKNRKNPFRKAGYKVLSGKDTNEVDSMMLKLIREAIKKDPAKKILVFIENKRLIEDFKKDLEMKGIKTVGIYSKKEKERGKEELSIIELGHIPEDVQVILGTTAISAGMSIISGFNEKAETWVYCSSSSMNHEFTRLVQMSNRFRTSKQVPSYAAFKVFFQESSTEKQGNVFRYHAYVETEKRKAENSKTYIELLRDDNCPVIGNVDEIERNCGVYSDKDGKLRINFPAIESEGIMIKTYNNYNNFHSLIKELEEKFKCQFEDINESVMVSKKELLKNNKIKGDSNSIIKQIASDESYFNQLKEEYMAGRKDGELELVRNTLKGGVKKDLNHFLETELDYELVRKVFKVHQKSIKKSKKYCYIDDIKAIEKIKNIKRRKQVTLEVQLMEVLDKVFARNKKRLKFKSSNEISDFLKRCLAKKLKEKGLELDASRFKPDTFKKMLNIDVRPSNGKKFYTLLGFKDERYITLIYGLETVNEEVKEVA